MKLKIAFFCDAYLPTQSGAVVSAHTTAEELRARGHHVTIFAPRNKHWHEPEEDIVRFAAGHWYLATDFPVAWPFLTRASFRAEAGFRRENFDIVHSHSPFTIGTVGARWARRCKIPVVFTFHTLYHRYLHYVPAPRAWTRSSIVFWVRHHCYLCNHIIAPSRPVAQIVAHLQPRTPCSVIPTGIDPDKFASGDGEKVRLNYGVLSDEVVLLYAGRVVREKNLVFLLKTLAPLLKDKNLRVRLMIVGGGMFLEEMKILAAQMGIGQSVIFTGWIPFDEMRDFYAAADIFTFASRTETQGISIAEALAAGLPCVVVGAMGAAEAVTDGVEAFVVPPREEEFRSAVSRLIRDPKLRQTMSENARRKAPGLSCKATTDALLELYAQLIHR